MDTQNATLSQIKIKQEPGITIKQEPMGTAKSERLTSFRLPRDLTLGGLGNTRATKPTSNKKVYTPNLNAVRNKNTDVKTASNSVARGKTRNERNNKDKDGRGKKSSLIQTAGIFSEGLAKNTIMKSARNERYGSSREASAEILRRPTIKKEIKMDPDEENKRILDILKEEEGEDKFSLAEMATNMPVMLDNIDFKVKCNTEFAVKSEIKTEVKNLDTPSVFQEMIKENQNYFLLQLPDTLPGRLEDEKPEVGESGEVNEVPTKYCTINQLEEGYIGKIVRHKSGKVKLILGEMKFDITLGMDSGFLQELVSISTNADERSGNIVNLSTIKAKLNASPDWEYLFKNSK